MWENVLKSPDTFKKYIGNAGYDTVALLYPIIVAMANNAKDIGEHLSSLAKESLNWIFQIISTMIKEQSNDMSLCNVLTAIDVLKYDETYALKLYESLWNQLNTIIQGINNLSDLVKESTPSNYSRNTKQQKKFDRQHTNLLANIHQLLEKLNTNNFEAKNVNANTWWHCNFSYINICRLTKLEINFKDKTRKDGKKLLTQTSSTKIKYLAAEWINNYQKHISPINREFLNKVNQNKNKSKSEVAQERYFVYTWFIHSPHAIIPLYSAQFVSFKQNIKYIYDDWKYFAETIINDFELFNNAITLKPWPEDEQRHYLKLFDPLCLMTTFLIWSIEKIKDKIPDNINKMFNELQIIRNKLRKIYNELYNKNKLQALNKKRGNYFFNHQLYMQCNFSMERDGHVLASSTYLFFEKIPSLSSTESYQEIDEKSEETDGNLSDMNYDINFINNHNYVDNSHNNDCYMDIDDQEEQYIETNHNNHNININQDEQGKHEMDIDNEEDICDNFEKQNIINSDIDIEQSKQQNIEKILSFIIMGKIYELTARQIYIIKHLINKNNKTVNMDIDKLCINIKYDEFFVKLKQDKYYKDYLPYIIFGIKNNNNNNNNNIIIKKIAFIFDINVSTEYHISTNEERESIKYWMRVNVKRAIQRLFFGKSQSGLVYKSNKLFKRHISSSVTMWMANIHHDDCNNKYLKKLIRNIVKQLY